MPPGACWGFLVLAGVPWGPVVASWGVRAPNEPNASRLRLGRVTATALGPGKAGVDRLNCHYCVICYGIQELRDCYDPVKTELPPPPRLQQPQLQLLARNTTLERLRANNACDECWADHLSLQAVLIKVVVAANGVVFTVVAMLRICLVGPHSWVFMNTSSTPQISLCVIRGMAEARTGSFQ